MIRKRILLASLLKPVNDTRSYEKLGRSLAKLPRVEVHISGFTRESEQKAEPEGNLIFHPIFSFRRLSPKRLFAQRAYWQLLNKIKPAVIIVSTHELLIASWWYCRQSNAKLVYDIQENYFLNLTTQKVYPALLANSLGFTIRWMEKVLAPKIDHFILAEASYAKELPFLGQNFTVLENKFVQPHSFNTALKSFPVLLGQADPLGLLYSGTISELYGVLEAIQFTVSLRAFVPHAELTIIGYCADTAFLKKLRQKIAHLPFVTLIGGEKLVPHQQILEEEQKHHIGLLPYHPHPSTQNCIPTKLFEYQGNGLVVLAQQNSVWEKLLSENQAGLTLDYKQTISPGFVSTLMTTPFYQKGLQSNVLWKEEELKLQNIIINLLEE